MREISVLLNSIIQHASVAGSNQTHIIDKSYVQLFLQYCASSYRYSNAKLYRDTSDSSIWYIHCNHHWVEHCLTHIVNKKHVKSPVCCCIVYYTLQQQFDIDWHFVALFLCMLQLPHCKSNHICLVNRPFFGWNTQHNYLYSKSKFSHHSFQSLQGIT